MGCDIHMHIEYKKTINSELKWVCGDYYRLNPYYDRKDKDEPKYRYIDLYDDRNYGLFALLANVRNYGDTEYISEPKGLPKDTCEEIKKDYKQWGLDAHSCSYYTLRELLEYKEKHKGIKRSGYISPRSAELLDNYGTMPDEWCQSTSLKSWVWRKWLDTEDESLDTLIDRIKQRASDDYWLPLWLYEEDKEKAYKEADKIRIVFWFDN